MGSSGNYTNGQPSQFGKPGRYQTFSSSGQYRNGSDYYYPLKGAAAMVVSSQFVFISYSHSDTHFVDRLQKDLEANGVTTWIDKTGLKPGTNDWDETLRTALRAAEAVVLVASPNSRKSTTVKEEVKLAEMYRVVVIPVWAQGRDDEFMESIAMGLGLGGMQYCDARGDRYDAAFHELTRLLQSKITLDPPSPPEPTPSPQSTPLPTPQTPPQTRAEARNPYKGLDSFKMSDSGDFFGRDKMISDLIGDVNTLVQAEPRGLSPERMVAVVGPSGSGKSSVVMAGLLPKLQAGALPGSNRWIYLDPIVPGVHPIEALAATLCRQLPQRSLQSLLVDLRDDETRGLHLLACGISRDLGAMVVLMIDQFEELFNLTSDEQERVQFIDLINTAITESHGPVIVLLTLRADFYDRPMQYRELYQLIQHHQRSILPMNLDELREVIEKPAALPDVRMTFEGPLVGDLLFDFGKEVGGLPLLEFTLDQLFRRRSGHMLTEQAYTEIGGVRGALKKQAEDTYLGFPTEEYREMARVLFLRLIDPGRTEQDTTRRRATQQELSLPDAHRAQILREVTNAFVKARLLVEDTHEGRNTVEVAHEALIREWPRLRDWLRESRDDIRLQQNISEDTAEWLKSGKEEDRLYRGAVLNEAQDWLQRGEPSTDELAFIQASVAARDAAAQRDITLQKEREAMRRRNRTLGFGLIGAVALLLIISLGLGLFAVNANLQDSRDKLAASRVLLDSTFIVTNTSDNANTQGSLRYEINHATDGSSVAFKKGLTGTIVLHSELILNKNIAINGPGQSRMTISGNNSHRIFDIGNNIAVTISNLTITDGYAFDPGGDSGLSDGSGAGIYVGDQDLNPSQGSYEYSTVTLLNLTITNNIADDYGGGIMNQGILSMFNCTITSNKASYGGGLAVSDHGYTLLNNSKVVSNTASTDGGGIYNGYAVYTSGNSYFDLYHSTVSDNHAEHGSGIWIDSSVDAQCDRHGETVSANTSSISGTADDYYDNAAAVPARFQCTQY
jgi:TIR domain